MDTDWLKSVLSVVATHGPWAVFSFYITYKHFQLHARTIEVMTAVKTLIEGLECRGGRHEEH